jgi:hypothetical protein
MKDTSQIAFRDCLIEANRVLMMLGPSTVGESIVTLDAMNVYCRVVGCMDMLPLSPEEMAQLRTVADRLMAVVRSLGQSV